MNCTIQSHTCQLVSSSSNAKHLLECLDVPEGFKLNSSFLVMLVVVHIRKNLNHSIKLASHGLVCLGLLLLKAGRYHRP